MLDANGMLHDRRGRFARSAGLFSKLDAPSDDGGRPGAGGRVHALLRNLSIAGSGGGLYSRENPDSYMDWSSRRTDKSHGFEAVGDDGETVTFDMSQDELEGLHAALTESYDNDTEFTFQPSGYSPGDDDDPRYFDWTKRESATGDTVWTLEVGTEETQTFEDDDGEEFEETESLSTSFELTDADMRDWYTALTVTLLTNELEDA